MAVVRDFTAILWSSWTSFANQVPLSNTPVILTYSFPTTAPPSYAAQFGSAALSFAPFGEDERAAARSALNQWASVSGLTFVEVSGDRGDIRFSWLDTDQLTDPALAGFSGLGYSPWSPYYVQGGVTYPQTEEYWLSQGSYFDFGGDVFFDRSHIQTSNQLNHVLLHEIGHAIGFKHPFVTGSLNPNTLASDLDLQANTVMSYSRESPGTTLGLFDVAAVRYLYGDETRDGTQLSNWRFDSATETIYETGTSGSDYIRATGTHDVIDAGAGDDYIYTSSGNDVVIGGPGLDRASGGTGFDTYVAGVARVASNISHNSFGTTYITVPEGVEYLVDFERIQFTDGVVAYDISGTAGQVYRLYQAAFGRTPDAPGLSSNVHLVDTSLNLNQMSAAFAASAEFRGLYGQNTSDTQYVTTLYQNVLHRAPEAAGLAGWLDILVSGRDTRAGVLIGFSESAENHANVDPTIVQGIVLDRTAFLV